LFKNTKYADIARFGLSLSRRFFRGFFSNVCIPTVTIVRVRSRASAFPCARRARLRQSLALQKTVSNRHSSVGARTDPLSRATPRDAATPVVARPRVHRRRPRPRRPRRRRRAPSSRASSSSSSSPRRRRDSRPSSSRFASSPIGVAIRVVVVVARDAPRRPRERSRVSSVVANAP
jgi:hypothetical protein|tara:strand:- start:417 stop:944 length:528 start_codon:yes stop_codon:yes gene_type:complete